MSKLTDEQLEDLFRNHLLDFEKKVSKDGWEDISKKVSRNNFLKFGWKHFNIYQIAFSSFILVACIFYFVKEKNQEPDTEKITAPYTTADTVSSIHKDDLVEESIKADKEIISLPIKKHHETNDHLDQQKQITSAKEEKTIKDTLLISPEKSASNVPVIIDDYKKTELPKIKKVITVVERDTIIIKDSVTVKRKGKRR